MPRRKPTLPPKAGPAEPRIPGKALLPPKSLLPPMAGRRGRKRTAAQAAAELLRLCEFGLLGYQPGELVRKNNEERQKLAAGIAAERELPPEEAEAFIADAALSRSATLVPYRKLLDRLDGAADGAGRLLVLQRMEELQASCRHLDLIELEAVQAFLASKDAEVTVTESAEEQAAPARGKGRPPLRREERKSVNRVASEKLLETARRCVADRDRLQGEVFRLAIKLGLVQTTPEEMDAFATLTLEQLRGLLGKEISVLFSAEAAVSGEPLAAEKRLELFGREIQRRMAERTGGGRILEMRIVDFEG